MPGGVALSELISRTRLEAGHSSNVAHGQNARDTIAQTLNRVQETLAITLDWPELHVKRDIPLAVGGQFYAFGANLAYDRVQKVQCSYGQDWTNVDYGIGAAEYSTHDSSVGQRAYPVSKWQVNGDNTGEFEVWPVPSQAGTLRMWGQRTVPRMVNDADTCVLDATVLVLMAAGEILARQKSEDATSKLEQANTLIRNIQRRQGSDKRDPIVLGGAHSGRPRPWLDYIPRSS